MRQAKDDQHRGEGAGEGGRIPQKVAPDVIAPSAPTAAPPEMPRM